MERGRLGGRLGARQCPEASRQEGEPRSLQGSGRQELRGHTGLSKKWVGSEQGTGSTEGVATSAAGLPRGHGMEDSRLDLAEEHPGKSGKQEAGLRRERTPDPKGSVDSGRG